MRSVVYYTDIKLKHCSMAKVCIHNTLNNRSTLVYMPLCIMQTCTYVLTCIHIYAYIHMDIHVCSMYLLMYICMYVHTHTCIC